MSIQSAREIGELGHDLYKRIATMGNHWTRLGKNLGNAIDAYNQAVGSLESKVLPQARKFKTFEVAAISDTIDELVPLETIPRTMRAPEMVMAEE